ncbi:hypothetical protein C5L39_10090 [Corynebacterium alimapuense]|uniref:YihY/virulence factor BrkB family protein n=2 Tax=Corynebacterium alimapuense TaxID=1576874 RepID=A0A3M8K4T9_9CORY|nr:hypothetical protein C5L39_10090 [Corynebacterium alimapuense]
MLTYYTVLSFAPTLLAVYSIATLFLANNAELVSSLVDEFITTYIPDEFQGLVTDIVTAVIGSAAGGVVGLIAGALTALWSASAYVRAFSRCANSIYGQPEGRGLIWTWGTMLVTTVVLVVGLVLLAASVAMNESVVSAVFAPVADPLGLTDTLNYLLKVFLPVWGWIQWPVILGLAIALIAVLYYYTPNVRLPKFRWFSPGSLVALAGVALVVTGFYLYLLFFTALSSYGAIGTLLALMFTLWGANISLLLGVTVNAEMERTRQLKEGTAAESQIHLPLRGTTGALRKKATWRQIEARGRQLRQEATSAAESD